LRVGLSLFPDLADALLLPIFIGDRLEGDGGSLFLLGPIFNFEPRVDANNSISEKNSASTRPIAAGRPRRGSL
jgi:hypothetical protein